MVFKYLFVTKPLRGRGYTDSWECFELNPYGIRLLMILSRIFHQKTKEPKTLTPDSQETCFTKQTAKLV